MADPAPRHPRRARRTALAVLAVLALAAVLLWEFLPALVERVAIDRLVAMGIPSPQLTVSRLGPDGAVLTGVVLGEAGELTVREVRVAYRLPDLFSGEIGDIAIRGARLRASIGPDGLSVGSLDPLLAGGDGGSEIALPPIRLEDSRLELTTPAGPIALTGNGTITLDGTAILATLDLDASAPQGSARGTMDLQVKDGAIAATLRLAESRLSLPDLIGATVSGDATLRVVDGDVTALHGAFSLTGLTVATPMALALPPLHGGMTVERGASNWQASLTLADPGGDLAVDLRLSTPAPDLEALVSVGLDVDATFAAPLWPLLDLPQPTAGDVGFHLVMEIQPSQLAEVLAGGGLPAFDGTLVLEAEELSWPGRIASLSGVAGFDLLATDSGIAFLAPAPTQIELTLAPAVLDEAGLSPDLATISTSPLLVTIDTRNWALSFSRTELKFHGDPQLEIGLAGGQTLFEGGMNGFVGFAWPQNAQLPDDATLAPAPKQAATFRLDELGPLAAAYLQFGFDRLDATLYPPPVFGVPDGVVALTGTARGDARGGLATLDLTAAFPTIAATGIEAGDLELDLPLEVTRDDGTFTVRLRDKGSLAIARLVGTTPLTLDGPVHLPFMPGDVPLLVMNFDDPRGLGAALDLSAGPLRLSGSVGTEDGPLPVTASLPRLHLTGDTEGAAWSARLQTRRGSVALPTFAMAATGVEVSVDLAGDASPTIGLGATLTHEGDPAYVVPLTARISAQQQRNGWAFSGSAKDPFDRISLAIEGRHDLVRGTGGATLKLAPIEFAPNVRQPGDLAPWLAGYADEVSGTVALAGDVSWTSDVVTSNLELLLRDLSFTTAAATIERVNGVIAVDGLAPYSTPPGQKVAVARIDAGLPLTDGLITFQIAPGPRLEIAGGTLHLAGGTVELEPLTFDPAGSRTDGVLQVEGVELGELLALAGVNGLTGSGVMNGRIPVAIEKEDVIITGGVLDAQAPGFLSYAPLSPPAALQGQGETVSLALSALTNFQYQALRLTVDRQAGGEMTVTMHVRGNNPDFYDGYPVEFNLNVSGALDQVLRDSLAGYRIPETIEERLNEFAQ